MKKHRQILQQTDSAVILKQYDRVELHECQMPLMRARLAESLAKQLAFATSKFSGEYDKAGRGLYVVLPPDEVAVRACEIADAMMREFDKRGWVLRFDQKLLTEEEHEDE